MTDPKRPLTLKELTRRLLRHWPVMAAVAAAVMVAVVAFTLLVSPRYESAAVVRIMEDEQSQLLGQALSDLPGGGLLGLGGVDLDTEIGVLRSWRIAEAVVDSLALMVRLDAPTGIRRRLFHVVAPGDPERYGEVELRRGAGGVYDVRFEEEGGEDAELGQVAPGEEFTVAGYRIRLADGPPEAEDGWPPRIRLELLPRYDAVEQLREDLEIRQQEAGSRLVLVRYVIPDRFLAAAVVNAIVDEYVAYKTSAERGEARYTVEELRGELSDQRAQLRAAEDRLRAYQERARIVAPEEEAVQQVQRLAELQVAADAVQVEREALTDLLALIDRRGEEPDGETTSDTRRYRQLMTFPSFISNGAIQELLVQLMELETERSQLLVLRTPENPDVDQLTKRIQDLERQLHRLGTDYRESLELQLGSTHAALDELTTELERLPEQQLQYLRLLREVEVLGEGYLLLQQQLRLAEVQDAIRSEGVRIVDRGLVAHEDNPEFPKPAVNLLLGVILAGTLGVGSGLLRDLWVA